MLGQLHLETINDPSLRYKNAQVISDTINKLSELSEKPEFASFWPDCKVSASTINTEFNIINNCNRLSKIDYSLNYKDTEQLKQFLKLVAEYNGIHFYDYDEQYLISSEIIIIEVSHNESHDVVVQFTNNLIFDRGLNLVLTKLLRDHPSIFIKAIEYLCLLESKAGLQAFHSFLETWNSSPLYINWIGPSVHLGFENFAYLTNHNHIILNFSSPIAVNKDIVDKISESISSDDAMAVDTLLTEHHANDLLWFYLNKYVKNVGDMPTIQNQDFSIFVGILESMTTVDVLHQFTINNEKDLHKVCDIIRRYALFKEFCEMLFKNGKTALKKEFDFSLYINDDFRIALHRNADIFVVEFNKDIIVNGTEYSTISALRKLLFKE